MNGRAKRRHIIKLPAIVVATLLVATTGWASENIDSDPVLAVVNGYEIRRSYVDAQIESMPLGDQVDVREKLDRFIESVVREEVLFQSMLASEFSSEPELREEIKALVVKYLIDRYVTERVVISEQAVAKYYRDNASVIRGENVRASEIRLAQKEDCESLMRSIDSQQAFEAAARERSTHRQSAEQGGDIGFFMNHEGPFGFELTLFEMEIGEMRVFQSTQGCHIVRLIEHEIPPMPPLEDVELRIRDLLRTQQERELLGELLERGERDLEIDRMGLNLN